MPLYNPVPGGGATLVRKTADEIVNNSIVLQDDNDLKLAVKVNEVWYIRVFLKINSPAGQRFKWIFNVPAGATLISFEKFEDSDPSQIATRNITAQTDSYTAGGVQYLCFYALYVGAAAAGYIQLQWAQTVAAANDTTVYENSHLIAHKLT